jgi:hypothetical protein
MCLQMIKDCEKRLVKTEEQIVNGIKEMVPVEDHTQELLDLVEEIFPQPSGEPQGNTTTKNVLEPVI